MKTLLKNAMQQRGLIVLAIALCLVLVACSEEPPLKIGFVGGMTGRVADLGIAGRDGVIFAIEEKNQAGGIAGRMLELVVRDDHQDADELAGGEEPVEHEAACRVAAGQLAGDEQVERGTELGVLLGVARRRLHRP